MEKGEIAQNEQFHLFPQGFRKGFLVAHLSKRWTFSDQLKELRVSWGVSIVG